MSKHAASTVGADATTQLRARVAAADPAGVAPHSLATSTPDRRSALLLRRIAPIAAGAMALTVAITVFGTNGASVDPAAAAVLNRAADLQPLDPPIRGDQVVRVEIATTWDGGCSNRVEFYPASGEASVIVDDQLPMPAFLGGPEGDNWQSPSLAFLDAMPRETEALRERLYRDSAGQGPGPDVEAFVFISDILQAGPVPADLRASLFRVAATIPGVEILQDDLVVDGRPAVAIGRNSEDGAQEELIFDIEGGSMVATRGVSPEGAISEARITRTVVDEIPPELVAAANAAQGDNPIGTLSPGAFPPGWRPPPCQGS